MMFWAKIINYKAMLANEMNFGMKHSPYAGLITRPVDLQSSVLLCAMAAPFILQTLIF